MINKSFLEKSFYVVVGITFLIASYFQFRVIDSYLLNSELIIFYILVVFITFVLFFVFYLLISKIQKRKFAYLLFGIIFAGIVFRFFNIEFLKTYQTSDFGYAGNIYELLESGYQFTENINPIDNHYYQSYFAKFPAWFLFNEIVLSIFSVFGYSYAYIKLLNIFLYVISSIVLYFGVSKLFNRNIAMFVVLIMTIFPHYILYVNLSSPDHFSILIMSLIIFVWSIVFKESDRIKNFLYLALLMLLFCLLNLFKPLSIYMVLVYFGIFVFYGLSNKDQIKENIMKLVLVVILFFGFSGVVTSYINNSIESKYKIEVVDATPLYLTWGYSFNPDTNIFDSNYLYNKYWGEILISNDYNLEDSLDEMHKVFEDEMKNNYMNLPRIFYEKANIVFGNDISFFSWCNTNPEYNNIYQVKYNNFIGSVLNAFISVIYLLSMILGFYGIFSKKDDKALSLVFLMIMGYIAILILGGVQPRYKILIFPQLAIVSAACVNHLTVAISNKEVRDKQC